MFADIGTSLHIVARPLAIQAQRRKNILFADIHANVNSRFANRGAGHLVEAAIRVVAANRVAFPRTRMGH